MPTLSDGDTFIRGGVRFRVHIEHDDDSDAPWDREDGHGPVRTDSNWRHWQPQKQPQKRPGERVLHRNRGCVWLYDWQAACKLARSDGWNAKPYDAPYRIERAVQNDFDRLRRWLSDDWWYIGVCVVPLDADGCDIGSKYDHALWGIESDACGYLTEVANELADDALEYRREAWRRALRQRREVRHLHRLAQAMAGVLQ